MENLKYFFLNGEKYSINSELTIFELMKYFNFNTSLMVLEYNHLIFNQKKWNTTFVKNNDTIEIVTIVGGG